MKTMTFKQFYRLNPIISPTRKKQFADVQKWFDEEFDGELYLQYIDPESSSLNDALLLASSLVPQNKSGKILLISDGEYRGINPLIAASEAQRRNIKIDLMRLNIDIEEDVGVRDLTTPKRLSS